MHLINKDAEPEGLGPFVHIDNATYDDLKCFWHKVRCKVCGDHL